MKLFEAIEHQLAVEDAWGVDHDDVKLIEAIQHHLAVEDAWGFSGHDIQNTFAAMWCQRHFAALVTVGRFMGVSPLDLGCAIYALKYPASKDAVIISF